MQNLDAALNSLPHYNKCARQNLREPSVPPEVRKEVRKELATTQSLRLDWSQIDVVLFDMDGTLIDLNFDNMLWNSYLPEAYAQAHQMSTDSARELLFAHMHKNARTIEFYSIDYWAEFTGLDIMQLHRDLADLVRYRSGTEFFLKWLQGKQCQILMATNAHRSSLNFKAEHLNMLDYFDEVISSHDYQQVKESQEFWNTLKDQHNIDPSRALFIDDNETVLDAAAKFGIANLRCVASPDSKRSPRTDSAYPIVHSLADLADE